MLTASPSRSIIDVKILSLLMFHLESLIDAQFFFFFLHFKKLFFCEIFWRLFTLKIQNIDIEYESSQAPGSSATNFSTSKISLDEEEAYGVARGPLLLGPPVNTRMGPVCPSFFPPSVIYAHSFFAAYFCHTDILYICMYTRYYTWKFLSSSPFIASNVQQTLRELHLRRAGERIRDS